MAKEQLDSIQALRGIAALAVVFHHAFRSVTVRLPDDIHLRAPTRISTSPFVALGAVGVDLFFVLSGFLMIYISAPYIKGSRTVDHFLAQRAIRIWPLYAFVTALMCLIDFLHKGYEAFDLQPVRLLSFVFIPSFNENGAPLPILGVGWTLNYEAMFYLVFAMALLLFRKRILAGLVIILGCLFILGNILPGTWLAHGFLSDSIIFEFLLGSIIGTAYLSNRLPIAHALVWIAVGLVWLALVGAPDPGDLGRFPKQGIGVALIFVGVLHLRDGVTWPHWLVTIGNASYSLYLVHTIVIYALILPIARRAFRYWAPPLGVEMIAFVGIAASIATALLCYRFVERPLLNCGHSAYKRLSASTA